MRNRILFDTTYLLPLLGIEVKNLKKYDKYIKRILNSYEVYYHPVSLIEAKWALINLRKKLSDENWKRAATRYRLGLNYILESDNLHQLKFTNAVVEEEIDYLITQGYRDYFDLLIFTTSYIENTILVTEDKTLKEIPRKLSRYGEMKVLDWRELTSQIEK